MDSPPDELPRQSDEAQLANLPRSAPGSIDLACHQCGEDIACTQSALHGHAVLHVHAVIQLADFRLDLRLFPVPMQLRWRCRRCRTLSHRNSQTR